jgi:replicative DNA helicase
VNDAAILLPPHSLEAEQALLGALLSNNAVYDRIADILTEADFYRHDHRLIYARAVRLIEGGKPADAITVHEALREDSSDVGGLSYLGGLSRNGSPANARSYAKTVKDHRIARDLIDAAEKMQELAYGQGDIGERLEQAQALIANMHEGSICDDPVMLQEVLCKVVKDIEERFHQDGALPGLSTGLVDLDKKTTGLHQGDLIIVAGRPSMGKTALALQIGQQVAIDGFAVLVFSLEMKDRALVERTLANIGRISGHALRTGALQDTDWSKIKGAIGKLKDVRLLIDQSSSPSIAQMRAKARRTKCKHGLDLVIVDYIQLMRGEGSNRTEEVSSITRGLKLLAQELDVPLIAVSQLSRKLEDRGDKRPFMSDLRDSGSIEQEADLILFVYRDEYYTKERCQHPGVAEVNIAKQRMGETGQVLLTWQGEFCRFDNYTGGWPRRNPQTSQSLRAVRGFIDD